MLLYLLVLNTLQENLSTKASVYLAAATLPRMHPFFSLLANAARMLSLVDLSAVLALYERLCEVQGEMYIWMYVGYS
jgi:hypothetical protein